MLTMGVSDISTVSDGGEPIRCSPTHVDGKDQQSAQSAVVSVDSEDFL
jgi:hypothetical protein